MAKKIQVEKSVSDLFKSFEEVIQAKKTTLLNEKERLKSELKIVEDEIDKLEQAIKNILEEKKPRAKKSNNKIETENKTSDTQ